ncbi:hypothetical protein SEA_JENOS_55 [Microbacterium phage Jenos]|uniref:Uncharacterized protein n=1 Tax=Microbacterium phage McGalleon TaxID=2590936 RepID=A0A516KR27_9CAUD|nr:hypothetical protein H3N88_gp54 [Microbacterium phage McGalleon]QDP44105.1 hypothetical protein SEA_MCGALLEON_54 [Microbacterium phage McGalleon]QXO14524.1 hypothetical protein SEA_JENOS_55 [Microbacterium phage Jenos]
MKKQPERSLSITEGLVAQLVEQDNIDCTNAVYTLRKAQQAIMEECSISELGLYTQRPEDEVDGFLIWATHNGQRNIFIE